MSPARRGAPLMFLGAVVAGWIAARIVTYAPLWAQGPAKAQLASPGRPAVSVPQRIIRDRVEGPAVPVTLAHAASVRHERLVSWRSVRRPDPGDRYRAFEASNGPVIASTGIVPQPPDSILSPSLGIAQTGSPERRTHDAVLLTTHWSGDGWVLWRRDSSAPLLVGNPGYGRSQAGAVLRYSFARGSGHLPQVHLRASAALSGPREEELAGGISARPVAGVPLRIAVETRVSKSSSGTELRPAAFAVTELPPVKLPLGTQGELYLQGGYVGGRFATPFVDGQARVERPIAETDDLGLRVGAGAWGGAQNGASRLDAGPTASVTFRLGDVRGRVAADYRFRVAGKAEPASGPTLTVSAGF